MKARKVEMDEMSNYRSLWSYEGVSERNMILSLINLIVLLCHRGGDGDMLLLLRQVFNRIQKLFIELLLVKSQLLVVKLICSWGKRQTKREFRCFIWIELCVVIAERWPEAKNAPMPNGSTGFFPPRQKQTWHKWDSWSQCFLTSLPSEPYLAIPGRQHASYCEC